MYTLESRVRYSECDEHGRLSLLALINYLQDCSTFHSETLGRGVQYMHERRIAWLIAAWQIEIRDLPRFCDEISVSTWCHDVGRSFATRNFVICDKEGTQLVRAESLWFVFDHKAGRAIRIPEDQQVFLSDEPRLDMPKTERRIRVEGSPVEAAPIIVGEMHLDSNRHVNNAQYLAMAINAITSLRAGSQPTEPVEPRRICVQYKAQAHLGDTIVPRVYADGSTYTVDLASPEGESFAIARIEVA